MVDALIAVLIVSLMVAVCVTSVNIARKLNLSAERAKQARLTLSAVMTLVPQIPGRYTGRRNGLDYTATVVAQRAGSSTLCEISVSVVDEHHAWHLDATRWCRPEGAAL